MLADEKADFYFKTCASSEELIFIICFAYRKMVVFIHVCSVFQVVWLLCCRRWRLLEFPFFRFSQKIIRIPSILLYTCQCIAIFHTYFFCAHSVVCVFWLLFCGCKRAWLISSTPPFFVLNYEIVFLIRGTNNFICVYFRMLQRSFYILSKIFWSTYSHTYNIQKINETK